MVDFSSLQISTLRRYRRHFKLQNKAGMNKSQLLEVCIEFMCLKYFSTSKVVCAILSTGVCFLVQILYHDEQADKLIYDFGIQNNH